MMKKEIINGITFVTIENKKGLKIVFSSLGASIFAIFLNNELMTLSLANKEDYLNPDLYHGKTIGPVCGRILKGQIGDFIYQMNEENVTRHGGNNGLSSRVFGYVYQENNDTLSLIFALEGFKVSYLVKQNENSFRLEYGYIGKPQPVALTNHTFFHLGSYFEELEMKIPSDYFIENDPVTLVPLKKKALLPCLNFNEFKNVSKDVNDPYLMESRTKGYDHYLHFANEKKMVMRNKKHQLEITTDFDGVLFYSDNYAFNEETLDQRIGIRKALAVEPQDDPLKRKIYSEYHRFISYSFIDRILFY